MPFNVVSAGKVELPSGVTLILNSDLTVAGMIKSTGTVATNKLIMGADDGSQIRLIKDGADTTLDFKGIWRLRAVDGSYAEVLKVNPTGAPASQIVTGFPISGHSGSAVNPGYAYLSEQSLGLYRSGVSTVAMSYGTLNLATQGVRLSMRTIASSALTASAAITNVAVNEVVVTIQASGASFAINSGGTTWIFHSDASAKNT